ncbi:MAG TPA: hypothetical protein VHV08_05965, partial [Pirellulales bacterium]|nr:hypothetical protein [Pirellulales bacterium]
MVAADARRARRKQFPEARGNRVRGSRLTIASQGFLIKVKKYPGSASSSLVLCKSRLIIFFKMKKRSTEQQNLLVELGDEWYKHAKFG